MKHTTTLLLALLLLPAAAALADIDLQRYDPTPAQPGDLLTVYVSISNDANDAARNVQAELLPTSTIAPEGRNTISVGTLGARGTHTASRQVRVANDVAGQAVLRMRVRQANTDWQERTATIPIKGHEGSLAVKHVDIQPPIITPGRTANVTLTISSSAGSLLRDVVAQLTLDDTPFVTDASTARRNIGEISGGAQATTTYRLTARPDASADIYSVPVTITFLDADGENRTQQDRVGLRVTTEQNTVAIVEDAQRTSQGTEVTVRIVNKGLSEIKFLQAAVEDAQGYTINAQQKQAYLGNVDSDDWETLRFTVDTDQERIDVPLTYSYEDTFNNQHQDNATLSISIPPQDTSIGAGTLLLIALVIIGGGYWLYKRRKN